jgi:hypothetical protein
VHGNIDKEQPDMYNSSGSLDINTPLFPDEAGVVILLGGTTIENAVNAVATTVPGYPWSDQVDRWGGLVIADGVTFRNNFRAAEFSRYPRRFSGNTFKNKSLFSNCYFLTEDANDTRSLGITAWDTDGITVTKSTFKNIGRESFGSIDGSFIIENGNTFINDRGVNENHRHILSMATYPYSGTSVIGSESSSVLRNEFFSNNPFDIFVSASTSAGRGGVQVLNNDFYGGNNSSAMNSAIEIDGPSAYLIKGNFIEASRLINITNTGSNQFARGNFVLCNTINNSEGSIAFREDNSGSKFRGNIFTGTGSSLVPAIFVDGIVDPFQGNASQPANNRFETTQQVLDIGVSPSSLRFNYYYSNSGSSNINAFEPRGNSNYNKNFTTTIGLSNCFSGRPPLTGIKEENIVAAQNQYENVIITANSASVQGLKQIEDAKLNRDNLLNDYIDAAINENNLAKINLFLPQIPGPKAKIRHYGACVELSDFVKAQLLLTEINNLGAEYDDFVDVQLINLDRLGVNNKEYNLTQLDSISLDAIARSDSESRGYARALMYLLKGKRYYDGYDEKSLGKSSASSEAIVSELGYLEISIYPNPVSGDQISVVGTILKGEGKVSLRRLDGSLVSVTNFRSTQKLSIVTPDANGIYFVEVTNGEDVITKKIFVKR